MAGLFVSTTAVAQECAVIEQKLVDIQNEYQPRFDAIEAAGKKLEDEAPSGTGVAIGADFDVNWEDQRFVFNAPEVRMTDKTMVFGSPQVTITNKKMAVDIPATRMVAKKVGQYPEVVCRRPWSCTVKWRDIITHVPEAYMQRTEWVMGVPETRWENTQIKMDLPEISMSQQTWITKIPKITVKNPTLEAKRIEKEGEELKSRGEALAAEIREQAANTAGELVACHTNGIQAQRTQVAAMFDGAVMQANAAIETARLQKADPANLTGSDGQVVNLIAQRDEILQQRDKALKSFDDASIAMQQGLTTSVDSSIGM